MTLHRTADDVHQFISEERDFVRAQSHAAACRDGHPGAPHPPFWTHELEDDARLRFEGGERHAPFDTSVSQAAQEYATEHRWVFHGPHEQSPLHLYATDPQQWRIHPPVFQIWLRPDGTFYAGHHRSGAWLFGDEYGSDAIDHFLTLCVVGELALSRADHIPPELRIDNG